MAVTPMQGIHSMWYDHYKGAVYPLDLDGEPSCKKSLTQVPSLLDACCTYIARDASLTRQAIEDVPPILCIHLMEAALRGNHDRSVQALMARWRLSSLVLAKLVPSVFSSPLSLYDSSYQADLVRQGMRYTTSLAQTFLECLKNETPTKIRRLDLTGFPTAEVILYYLTSHCMLVHNENRRNNMVSLYNQAVSMAEDCGAECSKEHKPLDIDMHNCLPEDITIEIKLDAFVTSESCHSELCKALTVSSFPCARFSLHVQCLSITCLGGDRVNLLLKLLKQDHLRGLQLKYNSLRNRDFLLLAPTLQSMSRLTALDLSCNHLSLVDNSQMATILQQALSGLLQLQRLDLSNSRLKNKLSVVLAGVKGRLRHLRLVGCGLSPLDLSSLARLVTMEKHPLEELDLSENRLGLGKNGTAGDGRPSSGIYLVDLLSAVCDSLRILELQECELDAELACGGLVGSLCPCSNLLMLNLQANPWSSETTLNCVGRLLAFPSALLILQLSYPLECYTWLDMEDEMDAEDQDFQELQARFSQSLNKLVRDSRNTKVKLLLSDMESSITL